MTQATLGFIFNADLSKVLLITKNRPEVHKGKINGVGGKTEENETSVECMAREVREETGLVINTSEWIPVGELNFDIWAVTIFTIQYHGLEQAAHTLTDEPVAWYPVSNVPKHVVTNLNWLIPLCIDIITSKTPPYVHVQY